MSVALEQSSSRLAAGEGDADPSQPPFVVLTVADNGRGMTLDVAANAFSPFFSTHSKRMGLGLTSAKRVITGHGGEIDLSSTEAGGTVVVVRLPGAE